MMRLRHLHDCLFTNPRAVGNSFGNNLANWMATADASGPVQRPLIDGMVAVNRAGGVAVNSKRCCKSRPVSFSR
jgi:hypothetical protein